MSLDRSTLRVYALLFGLAIFAHFPGLLGGFTNWDDPQYVTEHQRVQAISVANLSDILNPRLTRSDPFPEYAPVRDLSFLVDFAVWGGDPFGFHLTNVLLHALNTVLLSLFLLAFFGQPRVAVLVALLFACHPVHVESVAWISSRKDLLGLFFSLLSMILFFRGEREGKARFWGFSVIALGLALLSKSQAVTVPVILAIGLLGGERKKLVRLIPHALVVGVFLIHFLSLQFRVAPPSAQYEAGFEPNVLAILQTFARYGWHVLFPFQLSPYYDLGAELKEVNVGFVLSLAWLVGFVSIVIYAFKRFSLVAVSLLLFLLQLLPVLNLLPHPIWVADRYLYFASFFLLWPLALGGLKLKERFPAAGRYVLVILVALLAGITWKQSLVWQSSETLWKEVLQRYPDSTLAHLNLGDLYRNQERFDEAELLLERGLALEPKNPKLLGNLGAVLVGKKEYERALRILEDSLRIQPRNPDALFSIGSIYQTMGRHAEAQKMYQACLAIDQINANCNARLGNVLAKSGELKSASAYLERAILSDSNHVLALYDLAILSAKQNDLPRAKQLLKKLLTHDPDHQEARKTLSLLEKRADPR